MRSRRRLGRLPGDAQDEDAILEKDMVMNLLCVFLALIGAPAMVTAAKAASQGAGKGDDPIVTVYVATDATLRVDSPESAARSLDDVVVEVERRLRAPNTGGPVVLCPAPDASAEQFFHVLRRINGIPGAKTFLSLQDSPSAR